MAQAGARSRAYDVDHHRRRRPWPVDRLLPRQGTRHQQCRGVEKGWLGSGNIGRNTTIVRSNYLLPESIRFYEHSMKLWENLSHDLNYNVMFSQRGVLNLAHTPAQVDDYIRRGNAMRHGGGDAVLADARRDRAARCRASTSPARRAFRSSAACCSRSAGTARHDAVAWGYARGADRRGVDILENCEVTGFLRDGDRITGVTTTRGEIRAKKVAVAVAGSTGHVMKMAGIERLPIESHVLQAFVSESLKPFVDTVVTFGAGHLYMSQSDKGGLVFGGDIDGYNSYAQRGNLPIVEEVMSEMVAMFPALARVRLLRSWGGIMDMSMDGSPIITKGPAARHVSQLRLVLRRLQGDAGFRLVVRLDDRQGRAARHQRALHARPLPPRHPHRREGPGLDAPAALGTIGIMLITCPYCGPRDVVEFTYQGDGNRQRPDPASTDQEAWNAYVYDRLNPAGDHHEIWQHSGGCRAHLAVVRSR